jgi:hypothetical protein
MDFNFVNRKLGEKSDAEKRLDAAVSQLQKIIVCEDGLPGPYCQTGMAYTEIRSGCVCQEGSGVTILYKTGALAVSAWLDAVKGCLPTLCKDDYCLYWRTPPRLSQVSVDLLDSEGEPEIWYSVYCHLAVDRRPAVRTVV